MNARQQVWKREQERGFPFNRTLNIKQATALKSVLGRRANQSFWSLAIEYGLDQDEAAAFAERNREHGEAA